MAGTRRRALEGVEESAVFQGEALDFVPLDPTTGKGRLDRGLAVEVAVAFLDAGQELPSLSNGVACGIVSRHSPYRTDQFRRQAAITRGLTLLTEESVSRAVGGKSCRFDKPFGKAVV